MPWEKFTHKISNNNKKGVYGFYNVYSRAAAGAGVRRNRPENSRGQTDFRNLKKKWKKTKKSRLRKNWCFSIEIKSFYVILLLIDIYKRMRESCASATQRHYHPTYGRINVYVWVNTFYISMRTDNIHTYKTISMREGEREREICTKNHTFYIIIYYWRNSVHTVPSSVANG